ncbi:hypothetical protein FA13DRAFT_1744080 [Coprinellus micaceus]|uniref:Uncharacterized protein n=1 Tax=Coprinellus micaceus TaxID=71717 RepID=A0A4Y7SD42_COPMI|nr:hypothetical protein FA13DRAFT_1744080 [Coprinellus micaceus]
MSTSVSDIVIFFIDIAEQPLARLLSTIAEDLARLDDDLFSVYLVTDTDDHPMSGIVEVITLHAVIRLLKNYMERIDELLVKTEYRSSLGGVWALVHSLSPSVARGMTMSYAENDI